jgi:hypothetical protein
MDKVILPKQKAITIFLVFAFGYYISNLLRAITATISSEKVNLYIPPEKCSVYKDEN